MPRSPSIRTPSESGIHAPFCGPKTGFDDLPPPNALPKTIHSTILLRNMNQALRTRTPQPVSTTLANPLDSATTTEPEERVPSPPRTPTQFTAFDFKENGSEDRRPTLEPFPKPTPELGTRSTSGLEPAGAQPGPECTAIQGTTSLSPITDPASPVFKMVRGIRPRRFPQADLRDTSTRTSPPWQ